MRATLGDVERLFFVIEIDTKKKAFRMHGSTSNDVQISSNKGKDDSETLEV